MAAHRDGGRAALGGFLYQIVAALGLRAMVEGREEQADGLAALLSVDGDIRIEHEKFDSDVVVEHTGSSVAATSLVQFKFSRQVPPPAIAEVEYKQIVHALADAASRARAKGRTIMACYLISNRPCNPAAFSAIRNREERKIASVLKTIPGISFDHWLEALVTALCQF